MVLRRAASSAACLLFHRASAFAPPCGRFSIQQASTCRRQAMSQQRQHPQLHGQGREASTTVLGTSARNGNVFAFDFDGVICNSQGESSRSGFRALRVLWPDIAAQLQVKDGGQEDSDDAPAWILDKMKELRPIVETGYENILLVRLLIEERLGLPVLYPSEELFDSWGPGARDALALRYGLSREELVDAFGSARDEWMEADFQGWLGANKFYEGIPEAISACEGEVYVITTKQTRFASALLEHAGIRVPLDRIFGLGTGPKAGVLAQLQTKHSGCTLVFLEDRVETLEAVCADSNLEGVRLYLCDWGFNTAAQRARGESNDRVTLVGTGDIASLLAP
ncbi:unnamed protein product [Ectocarpus fasciculatus]